MSRQAVAEEQAIQASLPTVGGELGQAEAVAMRGVHAPADVRGAHPVADGFEITLGDLEATTDGFRFQRREHAAGAEASIGQREELEKGLDDVAFAARAAVGDAEGNALRGKFGRTEHRLHKRRIGVDVRCHHDDVARRELRVALKPVQHLVMQNFQFAQRTVAAMDLDGIVMNQSRPLTLALSPSARERVSEGRVRGPFPQMKNVRLDAVQQRVLAGFSEILLRYPVRGVEDKLEEIAAEIAKRGEQAIARFEV